MSGMSVEVELVGPRAGQTCVINGHQFVNGVATLKGDGDSLSYAIRYLGRAYNAHPRGSEELRKAKTEYEAAVREMEAANGVQDDPDEDPEPGPADPVPGEGGSGDEATGQRQDDERDGDASPPEGQAGVLPKRDGHGDPGVSEQPPAPDGKDVDPPKNVELAKAVKALDPAADDHWTGAGLPKISAVEEAYGQTGVTRAMVEAAAPEWTREKAAEQQALDAIS